ncbi:helix-turn-helix domain-containing protein [Streptomyces sp. NPDC060064]|uniref:MerR family transcriptional regulator n=1 Tax=Streptomyces sp. NPDC060064 TaxID=3347049 RepID=UPI0036CEC1DD
MANPAMPTGHARNPDDVAPDRTRVWLRRASLAAGVAFTATAEYELARRMGAAKPIAVMLPVVIDCYVMAALRWFRAFDIALSLALMGAAQVAAHALDAGVLEVDLRMVVVVSLLAPIAIWRTHALARDSRKTHSVPVETDVVDVIHVSPAAVPERPAAEPVIIERAEQQDTAETPELPPVPPRLLTSGEVADRCGVNQSTVRSWVANGRLPVHEKDARGHNLFHPDALLAEASR